MAKILQKKISFHKKIQFEINGALFHCSFCLSLIFVLWKIFSDLKLAIEMSLFIKRGPGGKMGPRYKSSNLVLDWKMWKNWSKISLCGLEA